MRATHPGPTTISYSKQADALYIQLSDTPSTGITEEVESGVVMVDRDTEGHVVGIEILLATGTKVTFDEGAAA